METCWGGRFSMCLVLLTLGASACGGSSQASSKMAIAALNVGIAAAAMPIHQAITGCLTTCQYGTGCDEETGACVSLDELDKKRQAAPKVSTNPPHFAPGLPDLPYDDSCAGMCMSDERCVMLRGGLDCIPR